VRAHQDTLVYHQMPRDPFFDTVIKDIRMRLPLFQLLSLEALTRQTVINYINDLNSWKLKKEAMGHHKKRMNRQGTGGMALELTESGGMKCWPT